MNDCFRTRLILFFEPHVLACSCLFLAGRMFKFSLPVGINWWELFETNLEQLRYICAELLELYDNQSYDYKDVWKIFVKFGKIDEDSGKNKYVDKRKVYRLSQGNYMNVLF